MPIVFPLLHRRGSGLVDLLSNGCRTGLRDDAYLIVGRYSCADGRRIDVAQLRPRSVCYLWWSHCRICCSRRLREFRVCRVSCTGHQPDEHLLAERPAEIGLPDVEDVGLPQPFRGLLHLDVQAPQLLGQVVLSDEVVLDVGRSQKGRTVTAAVAREVVVDVARPEVAHAQVHLEQVPRGGPVPRAPKTPSRSRNCRLRSRSRSAPWR